MNRQEIIVRLREIIQGLIEGRNLVLFDLVYRYEGRNLFLRILVDRPEGGISLDECAYLNDEIGKILEEKDILQERYILEVSSPGLDQPLKTKNDFLRCLNKEVRVFLSENIDGQREIVGNITKVETDSVYIDSQGMAVELPLSKIIKAQQVINNT